MLQRTSLITKPPPVRALRPLALSVGVFLLLGTLALALFQVVAGQAQRLVDVELDRDRLRARQLIEQGLFVRVQALERLRDRLVSGPDLPTLFEIDAGLYLRDFPNLRSIQITDPESRVLRVEDRHPEHEQVGVRVATSDPRRQTFERARSTGRVHISPPLDLTDGDRGLLMVLPMFRNDVLEGYLVAEWGMDNLISTLLGGVTDVPLRVLINAEPVFAQGGEPQATARNDRLSLFGQDWEIQVWPSPLKAASPLPNLVLAGALLVAALMALTFWLLGVGRRRDLAAERSLAALSLARHAQMRTATQLRELEAAHRGLLDQIADLFLLLDADLKVIDLNPAAIQVTGLDRDRLLGVSVQDALPSLRDSEALRLIQQALRLAQPVEAETYLETAGQWIELRVIPGRKGLALYWRDVTDRKDQELKRLRKETEQARAQRLASVGSWDYDIKRRRLHASEEMLRIFGWTAHSFSGRIEELLEAIHPDDRGLVMLARETAQGGAADRDLEYRILRPDGSQRVIREISTAVRDPAEGVSLVTGAVQDVTAQRLAAAIDRRQRQILESIARRAPLSSNLEAICLMVDDLSPGAMTSVLLVDEQRRHFRHGAAPSLPLAYCQILDGMRLGPGVGSCGAAVMRRERVVVSDTRTDPLWASYQAITTEFQLLACWSTPIIGPAGEVLGTLAVYYREPRSPNPEELELIDGMMALCAIAIDLASAYSRIEESEQRFRSLFDQHPDGVVALDRNGRYLMVNDHHEQISGLDPSFVIGRLIEEVPVSFEQQRLTRHALGKALKRTAGRFEIREQRADGETAHIEIGMMPIVIGERVEGAFAMVRDLTALRTAQKRLVERDQFFELSEEAFCIVDPARHEIVQSNPAFVRLLGFPKEALVGQPIADFVQQPTDGHLPDPQSERNHGFIDRLTQINSPPLSGVHRYRTADGGLIWLEWSSRQGPDGRVFATARDISARQRAEEALARSLEDLRRRNQDLSEFAFVASHDLQEPLRKIRAFSDRVLTRHSDRLDEQGRFYLTRMNGAAERMQSLIDNLLAYSRVTTQTRPFEPVDLALLATQVLLDLEARVEATGAIVDIGPLPTLEGDSTQLQQVLQNLLANALKFVVEGRQPRIQLSAERLGDSEPGNWRLVCADNGAGFDPEFAQRLFMPFQRLHSRQEYEGVGMGLAIVKRIVERHGGTIDADGKPGQGASFVIVLPGRQPMIE